MADNHVHLISLNVQGLRDKSKRLRLNQWLFHQKSDITLLQETHFTNDLVQTLTDEFVEWNLYHSFGESNCRGVSILIKKQLEVNIIDSKYDNDGRYYFMNIETCDNTFSILNAYAPNDRKLRSDVLESMCTF